MLVRDGEAVQLSHAHTAENAQERERMLGHHSEGIQRVGEQWRVGPVGLQVTRCVCGAGGEERAPRRDMWDVG